MCLVQEAVIGKSECEVNARGICSANLLLPEYVAGIRKEARQVEGISIGVVERYVAYKHQGAYRVLHGLCELAAFVVILIFGQNGYFDIYTVLVLYENIVLIDNLVFKPVLLAFLCACRNVELLALEVVGNSYNGVVTQGNLLCK